MTLCDTCLHRRVCEEDALAQDRPVINCHAYSDDQPFSVTELVQHLRHPHHHPVVNLKARLQAANILEAAVIAAGEKDD